MGGIAHYAGTKEYKAQGLDFVSTEELVVISLYQFGM